jgi:hypothetical protein
VLAYSFTENDQFGAKTDQNSIFYGRNPYIVDRLSITAPYNFLRILKKFKFSLKIHKC